MTTEQVSDFGVVQGALDKVGSLVGAAECHGILCGMSCSGTGPEFENWMVQVLADCDPKADIEHDCKPVMACVYQETASALGSPELTFQPLLPDDDEALGLRTEYLGKWCAGFLFGMGLAGNSEAVDGNKELREMLRDLGEISRAQFDIEGSVEEAEKDFTEIVEYVRTAVLLMQEELRPLATAPRMQ